MSQNLCNSAIRSIEQDCEAFGDFYVKPQQQQDSKNTHEAAKRKESAASDAQPPICSDFKRLNEKADDHDGKLLGGSSKTVELDIVGNDAI